MSFEDKSLEEIELELKNSNFQWIKGENMGSIERFSSVSSDPNGKFLNFVGGNRINLQILGEFMDIFPASPINFDSSFSTPASSPPKVEEKGKVNSVNYESSLSGVEESPIYKLLKKQKPNWVNVSISLKLNLPTKSLYNVLISSFEDAESEIANYVTEGVDIEDIKEAIAESIRVSFYDTKKLQTSQKTIKNSKDELSED